MEGRDGEGLGEGDGEGWAAGDGVGAGDGEGAAEGEGAGEGEASVPAAPALSGSAHARGEATDKSEQQGQQHTAPVHSKSQQRSAMTPPDAVTACEARAVAGKALKTQAPPLTRTDPAQALLLPQSPNTLPPGRWR